ncbi:MAG: kelch repeat-containing protein, partial [Pseudomonadota bacterium]
FSQVAPLGESRFDHAATVLSTGEVLVTGGNNGTLTVSSAEIFDPGSGSWRQIAPMQHARRRHLTAVLPDDTVLVVGGDGATAALASAERYDPTTGEWTELPAMAKARLGHRVAPLPTGKLLAVGGTGDGSWELFDYGMPSCRIRLADGTNVEIEESSSCGTCSRCSALHVCELAAGMPCGRCQQCNASAACRETPPDDEACGTIDCDRLDRACRDYHDLDGAGDGIGDGDGDGDGAGRCAAFGVCKLPNTLETCAFYSDLPAGDQCGICQACDGAGSCAVVPPDDAKCGTIDCDTLDTSCRDYADLAQARCSVFGSCKTPNTVEACSEYTDVSAGAICSKCQACDGQGACASAAADDDECGTIDCDALDTKCRDYADLAQDRCSVFGSCKTPNTAETCSHYTDAPLGQDCLAPSCAGTVLNLLDYCGDAGQSGQCIDGGALDCAPFACAPSACLRSCKSPTDCASSAYCDGGECVAKRPAGAPCNRRQECRTGYCADGVCCNSTCAALCFSCDLAGSVGTCSPVPAGFDPIGECLTFAPCGGTCNGAGGCQAAKTGESCGTCQVCNELGSCAAAPDRTTCEGILYCASDETCLGGECVGTEPIDCSDGNPCTDDRCDEPTKSCINEPVPDGVSCTDGDACNGEETCRKGACQSGFVPSCDDGNPCTSDSCEPTSGCAHVVAENGSSCSLATRCGGECEGGQCSGGVVVQCDDGNPCTTDSCDPATTACVNVPAQDGIACDDQNECTADTACASGTCAGGTSAECDDGNICTGDTCDPATGCAHQPRPSYCDDGDPCTFKDRCTGGLCAGIPDPEACRFDAANLVDANPAMPDGTDGAAAHDGALATADAGSDARIVVDADTRPVLASRGRCTCQVGGGRLQRKPFAGGGSVLFGIALVMAAMIRRNRNRSRPSHVL